MLEIPGRNRMKQQAYILMAFMVSAGLFACQDNPAQQYGDHVIKGYKDAQQVREKADVSQLRRSAQDFNVMNGRYPADLKELEQFSKIAIDAEKYDYDPATGEITAKQ
ncbi:MAG: hypothetical protein A2X57_05535 [Nitrospirae bacterium GWD2_57_8]|nr:MAG: hypothetical protein A2X57_05535 [Nitrospirae bacterium GWD2_57_8]